MNLNLIKDFRSDEKGGILAFYLIMFITLMIGGGMAVDFMNSEYQREKVQDALDRGVLAAAAIGKAARAITPTQIAAAEANSILIVKSYLQGAGYDPEAPGVSIVPDFTLNSQGIVASANYEVDTFFLRLTGIDTLGGSAGAGALVTQNDIEISLVLDVSGSMAGTKIAKLRTAGSNFVGNMLAGERSDYTFISVIPFNHSVNIGAGIMGRFSNQQWHTYSGCATFTNTAMASVAMSPTSGMTQTGHINNNYLCDAGQSIVYSNNIGDLQALITGLTAGGATAGYTGMKWAMALLDPSADTIVTSLIADGLVSVSLAGKPAAYSDEETLKFIIFMSDGSMNSAYRFKPNDYAVATDIGGNLLPANSVENANYYAANPALSVNNRSTGPSGSSPLLAACDAADTAGIVVFSIAYGLTPGSSADTVLANCASSLGFYYNVATDDLDAAFASIEASIQALKLTN
ncbi:MAG: VWA domain-containing protein [Rhodobacteraceae bacterium]|nr:VWA domain-containing protein [Paracoccaceae bacterium]